MFHAPSYFVCCYPVEAEGMFTANGGSSSGDNEPPAYGGNESGGGASTGIPTIPVFDEKEQMERFAAQYLREIDSLRRQLAEQQQLLVASKETSLLFENNGDGAALLEAELSFNVAEVIAQTERHLINEAKRLRNLSYNCVVVDGTSTEILDAKAYMNRAALGSEAELNGLSNDLNGLSNDLDIPGNTPSHHDTGGYTFSRRHIHTLLCTLHSFLLYHLNSTTTLL